MGLGRELRQVSGQCCAGVSGHRFQQGRAFLDKGECALHQKPQFDPRLACGALHAFEPLEGGFRDLQCPAVGLPPPNGAFGVPFLVPGWRPFGGLEAAAGSFCDRIGCAVAVSPREDGPCLPHAAGQAGEHGSLSFFKPVGLQALACLLFLHAYGILRLLPHHGCESVHDIAEVQPRCRQQQLQVFQAVERSHAYQDHPALPLSSFVAARECAVPAQGSTAFAGAAFREAT